MPASYQTGPPGFDHTGISQFLDEIADHLPSPDDALPESELLIQISVDPADQWGLNPHVIRFSDDAGRENSMPNTDSLEPLRHPRTNRFRSRSLGAAASTAAVAGFAESASAAYIYDLTTSYSVGDTFSFDGTAAGELTLFSMTGGMGLRLGLQAPGTSTAELVIGMMASLSFLSVGDTVDGSLTVEPQGLVVRNDVPNPGWIPGNPGYAGFVFDNGTGPLYGWLYLDFDASGTSFTVTQWAYEDTGAAIQVGVPEPNTALLLGLGLAGLAMGLRSRRRRRSAASKQS